MQYKIKQSSLFALPLGALVGVTPVEFRGDLWHQKTRLPGLSCGFVL